MAAATNFKSAPLPSHRRSTRWRTLWLRGSNNRNNSRLGTRYRRTGLSDDVDLGNPRRPREDSAAREPRPSLLNSEDQTMKLSRLPNVPEPYCQEGGLSIINLSRGRRGRGPVPD